MEPCTIYLDASGDQAWTYPFGRSLTEWYVVAGLVVTPGQDHKASLETARILKKYISEDSRNQFPDKYYEIHFNDIINGNNIYNLNAGFPREKRREMADEILELILDINPILFATAINKKQLKYVYGQIAYNPKSLAIRATIHRFSIFLERENRIGSVIIDSEEYIKDKELQSMVHGFRRFGITIRGNRYNPMYENRLKNVLNNISFTPSHLSPGIQLADVCSKCTMLHFERGKSNRFNQLSALWDKNSYDRVFEPSIFPATANWIT